MILKFGEKPSDVFIIEATGDQGVSIKNFSSISHAIGDHYSKAALRHLDWERPSASLDLLE